MTTGVHRYVRHPFYVHFYLIPLGSFLVSLNYVALLLPYYLTLLGYSALQIGVIATATLLGSGLLTLLVGVYGAGLILAGVFVADAGAGFPPGAPTGTPDLSWHGIVHGIGAVVAFNGAVVACLAFTRRFAALKRWGWVAACVATAAAVPALTADATAADLSIRLVVATAILASFIGVLAARLRTGLPDAPARSPKASRVAAASTSSARRPTATTGTTGPSST